MLKALLHWWRTRNDPAELRRRADVADWYVRLMQYYLSYYDAHPVCCCERYSRTMARLRTECRKTGYKQKAARMRRKASQIEGQAQ